MISIPPNPLDPRAALSPKQIQELAIRVVKKSCGDLKIIREDARRERAAAEKLRRAEQKAAKLGHPEQVGGNCFLVDIPDYHPCSGGTRVLHYLAALLLEAGYAVATTSLCYYNPLIPVRKKAKKGDIVILCDGVESNHVGADRVCWWMIGKYFKGTVKKDECCIVYLPEFMPASCEYALGPDSLLFIPNIDPALGCWLGTKTIDACFYGKDSANKTSLKADIRYLAGAVTIPPIGDKHRDGQYHTLDYSHERTLAVLRAARNLYTTDHMSAIWVEAMLCGCHVWNVQEDGSAVKLPQLDSIALQAHVMHPVRDQQKAFIFGQKVLRFFKQKTTLSV